MSFWQDLFGGKDHAGIFGGGWHEVNSDNFNIPGFDQMQAQNQALAQGALGAQPQEQWRGQQQQLAQQLFGTIGGQMPSVAQQQLQQDTNRNIAQTYALAQSGPYNPAAARMAQTNAANLRQQAVGQAGLQRAQEIQSAQGLLGSVLSGGRGQDISNFGAQHQVAQGYLGQNLQGAVAQQQARQAYEQAQMQALNGAQQNAIGPRLASTAAGIAGTILPFLAYGGTVPGYATGGNSPGNDTVPAMLSPGEVVLPRTVTMADDAPERAKAFVAAIMKQKMKRAA